MGIKTGKEYIETLRHQAPLVHIAGQTVRDIADHPLFATSIKEMAKFYDFQSDPDMRSDFTYESPLTNETVGFWTHLRQSPAELEAMIRTMKHYNARHFCTMCMGIGLSVMWAVTWEIDQARGSSYHENFRKFFEKLQREDLRYCLGVMDPKGDRSKGPSEQADPDLHLRVVEKRSDGIVVRGAKMHTSNAPMTHYFFAMPCRELTESDADYALAFVMPVDSPGISYITRPAPGPVGERRFESPISTQIGFTESLTVLDDVFVPWENVFMCGEWEFTEQLISCFSPYVRLAKGACTSARIDIIAGAAALAAKYNGTAGAGHIKSKINDMMVSSQIGFGCTLGSIANGVMHPSGIPVPDISIANAGLYHTRLRLVEFLGTLMEIAGGVVTTMPIEAEYANPELGPVIDKYLAGAAGMAAGDRMKLLYFIQDMTASRFSGYLISSAICAGGTPETCRLEVARNYDLSRMTDNVCAMCGIGR